MKSLLQTQEWATLREAQGWKTHWVDEILILQKPLPLGLSFLYAPEVDFYQVDFAKNLAKIKEISQNSHSIFIRFDFLNKIDAIYGQKITSILKNYRFVKAFEEIQPEYRQIIDISKTEEQILAQMKSKGRYNIKIAQKHGVEIVIARSGATKQSVIDPSLSLGMTGGSDCHAPMGLAMTEGINDFYNIFRETAKRDGFEIRPKAYFAKLLEILGEKAELLVARYQGKILASAIITCYDGTASYLYGASSNENREVMAPYLLHWEAIKEAKRRNCKIYDLLAIEPFGEADSKWQIADSNKKTGTAISHRLSAISHKYSGITRFKEQFGGQKVHLAGSWDLIVKPGWYSLFKIVEKFRRR